MFINRETEINLLGAFLDQPARFQQFGNLIRPDLFADSWNRDFAAAYATLKERGHVPGESTLRAYFKSNGREWDELAEPFEVLRMSAFVTPGELPALVDSLDELARARAARELLAGVQGDAGLMVQAPDYLETVRRAGDIVRAGSAASVRPDSIQDVGRRVLATLQARHDAGGGLVGLSTGFDRLDKTTGGLRRGEITIPAARPGTGKTSFVLQVGDHLVRAGKRVMFVSLEMSADQLYTRLLAQRTGIPGNWIEGVDFWNPEAAWKQIGDAMGELHGSGWILDDAPNRTAPDMCAAIYARHAEKPLDLVILDYIQLVAERGREKRYQAIGRAVLELRAVAKALNIPVIIVSQLNRTAQDRPKLSDLRESGDLENHAALVLLLHRPALSDKDAPASETEIRVAKNRFGAVGKISAKMDCGATRFEEMPYQKSTNGDDES